VGEGALFNMPRFTMGLMDLQSGFSFITLAMAMFALPEAMFLVLKPKDRRGGGRRQDQGLRITREEARAIAPVIGRQSVQGFFIGVLPGAGATIASFLGYAVERNSPPRRSRKSSARARSRGSPRRRPPTTPPAPAPSCRC
jgi:putative tricarboxylic transport membrane protein